MNFLFMSITCLLWGVAVGQDGMPGNCPLLFPGTVGHCAEMCFKGGCFFGQLCCSNGCGHECKEVCPNLACGGDCVSGWEIGSDGCATCQCCDSCKHEQCRCGQNEACTCTEVCKCNPSGVAVGQDGMPGNCPLLFPGTAGHCAEMCFKGGCFFGQLCCSNGCGHECKKVCPNLTCGGDCVSGWEIGSEGCATCQCCDSCKHEQCRCGQNEACTCTEVCKCNPVNAKKTSDKCDAHNKAKCQTCLRRANQINKNRKVVQPRFTNNCRDCICEIEGCQKQIGKCRMDGGSLSCGPFQIKMNYWCDAYYIFPCSGKFNDKQWQR